MNPDEIKTALTLKYPDKYPEEKIDFVLEKIKQMDPDLRGKLETFLQTGKIEVLDIEGYSVDKLMEEHGMNEIAAFLTLDWIVRDPKNAVASLQKGHDSVRV